MKTLFSIAAILTMLLGIGWLFFPQAMLASWGVQADGIAVYMARRYGGLFSGYAAILWLGRASSSSPDSDPRRAARAGRASP